MLEHQSPLLNNFETFVEKFCAFFEDLNKEWTSTNNLQSIHQDLAQQLCIHSNLNNHVIFYGMKLH